MEVDRALVHGRVRAVALDEPEERAGLAVDDGERLRVPGAQGDPCGRVVAALPDVSRRRVLELGELGGAPERLAPERLRVPVVDRRLEGGGRARAGRGSAGSRGRGSPPRPCARGARRARARRTGRARPRSQTRIARPRSRRPARPHCCRSDATVPGKPTEIAQSSRPMSIPSSSASVAVTPRSSPSTSRRSISRRCSGVYPARYGVSRLAVAVSRRSDAKRWMSSAALRLFAKQIVRRPREVSWESRRAASPSALARRPSSASRSGGFQITTSRSARADVSLIDDRRGLAGQLQRELAGVRDRRRREQELRLGVVDPREPPEPPQDVRDVRAEHAPVHVRLVDDDVAEVREHVAPAVVVGEDADVEHVRVRQHEVRPLADLPAALARRVAVVDRRPQPLQPELGERAGLILRERLRRVEVERARLRLARDRVEHGEVERERLPGGRAGRDDDVLAAPRRLPGLRLVAVERGDAGPDERGGDARIEVVGQRLELRLARRLDAAVRDLLALEEIRPARCDVGRHAPVSQPG